MVENPNNYAKEDEPGNVKMQLEYIYGDDFTDDVTTDLVVTVTDEGESAQDSGKTVPVYLQRSHNLADKWSHGDY